MSSWSEWTCLPWNYGESALSAWCRCFIIFNQQFIGSSETIRLTDLPLNEYVELVPSRKDDFYQFVYQHADEICPEYQKRWKDVHNIWQWGITDDDLRGELRSQNFEEIFYRNYGKFGNLKRFENHGFVFLKK